MKFIQILNLAKMESQVICSSIFRVVTWWQFDQSNISNLCLCLQILFGKEQNSGCHKVAIFQTLTCPIFNSESQQLWQLMFTIMFAI
jgi:hypothetical protein